jgi:Cu2+-exporting ATPase
MLLFLPFIFGSTGLAVLEIWQSKRGGAKPAPRTASLPRLAPSGPSKPAPVEKVLDWFAPKNKAEEEMAKELKRVTVGLAVVGTGFVFFPYFYPLQALGVLAVVPTMFQIARSAYGHLRREGRVSADVLSTVFIAGSLAGGYLFALTVGGEFFVLVRWLAVKSEAHSKEGIIDLFGQHNRTAWVDVDGVEVEIPLERVQAGDLITVHGGQTIPTDGKVVEGHASVDRHMLTGESQPVDQGPGDSALAATVVRAGRLVIRVEQAGDETTAARIARMLTDTSDFTAALASRADAFNDKMALPFIVLSAASLPFIGLGSALAVLQATPGYRMVLFGPLSMLSYLHVAAEQGILIKDGRALESLRDVDTVVFDKTGTLTADQPHVCNVLPCAGFTRETVLTLAAGAEAKQTHPIARAILEEAAALGIQPPEIDEAGYEVGFGIEARMNGSIVLVGSKRFMDLRGIEIPGTIQAAEIQAHDRGNSLALVAVDQRLGGAIELEPTIRPEATAIVTQLRTRGLRMMVVSGDREAPTRHLAEALRLDGHFAEVLPGDKANLVKGLQAQGRKVCFVGDGINDSIALKSANVSVSLSGATTIAIDTAQIVLMEGNLVQLPHVFELATEFAGNMQINFLAATLPCVFILGGALFFGLGLLPSILLYQVSVPFALYNTVRPLLWKRGFAEDAAPSLALLDENPGSSTSLSNIVAQ